MSKKKWTDSHEKVCAFFVQRPWMHGPKDSGIAWHKIDDDEYCDLLNRITSMPMTLVKRLCDFVDGWKAAKA